MIRKFIIKNLVLYRHYKVFGKEVTVLRCVRIGMPLFLLMMLSMMAYQNLGIELAKYFVVIFLLLFAVYVWITFPVPYIGYFSIWPVKYEELDEEQKKDLDKWDSLKN